MLLEDYFDFLDPDDIRLRGHRLGIDDILTLYLEGQDPEQIQWTFPTLSLEEIHATITYYWHNRTEVDAYLERVRRMTAERMAAYDRLPESELPEVVRRLRTLKALRQVEAES
ncbi:conserved protein of unknown function [Candidatus Promineifilum breve]|uniref:DUF433 domain-containing protein n=1 Tax=Candidatus Promineifilum breve TaxID=1806508 RepID=A0A160T8S6_9CHLR|nr:DUF433 domain-containing protein [Candidatus Promineifilum breve]CUS05838.1 conserved protein of unknown function [Candidatus Promineifilum breve]